MILLVVYGVCTRGEEHIYFSACIIQPTVLRVFAFAFTHHTAECAYGKRCGGRVIASPSNIWAPKISTIHISMAFEGT